MTMGTDTMERTRNGDLARDETTNLIASNKVEGTAVYDRQGEKLGKIENFMVGKRNGRVEYAVLSFGGLLGMGENHYPLPWSALDYDTGRGGYLVNVDKDTLKNGPSYERGREPEFNREYGQRAHSHYGSTY